MNQSVLIDGTKIPMEMGSQAGRISLRLGLPVPAIPEPVPVRVDLHTNTKPWRPSVFARAPECLRHRYRDGALCMWFERDPNARRWMLLDGIPALVHHTRRHLYQEACCRAGEPWPGEQAPGEHPRPKRCRTCGGGGP